MSLFLAGVVLFFFLPTLAEGRMLGPTDGLAYYFPVRVVAAGAIASGELPFWNPYIFSGTPFLAAMQPGLFFPGNWTFWVLPPYWANNLTVLASFWVAGAAAYALARAMTLPRLAALVPALTFMFGGFMTMHVAHMSMLQAAALLPLVLWAVERFAASRRARYPIAGSLIVGFQLLAGHPQMTAYTLILATLYGAWRGRSLPREARPGFGLQLGLMLSLGVGLATLQLLPTLDLIQVSQRQAISFERLTLSSLPLAALPALLSPYVFGCISPSNWLGMNFWANTETFAAFLEGYTGLAAVILALLALFRWRENGQVRFWAVAAAGCLILAMGSNTPIYQWWAKLPAVGMMPYASRHLMIFTLAVGLLGGWGLARLETAPAGRHRRSLLISLLAVGAPIAAILAAVAIFGTGYVARTQALLPARQAQDLAATLTLANPGLWVPLVIWIGLVVAIGGMHLRPAAGWRAAFLVVLLADLFLFVQHQHIRDPEVPTTVSATRTIDWDRGRTLTIRRGGWPYPMANAYGPTPFNYVRDLNGPNVSMLSGVPTIGGYDAFILDRYSRLLRTGSDGTIGERNAAHLWQADNHILDLLAVRTLYFEASVTERPFWRDRLQAPRWVRLPDENGLERYENRRALPHAWRVERASVMAAAQVDAQLADASFDPRREALLEAPMTAHAVAPGVATAEARSLNRIRLETDGPAAGLVVVSESYDPGWRAYGADGELPVHRANGLIMAVEVPAGAQRVELVYEPRRWRTGLTGSGLALGGLVAWGFIASRFRRRERP